MRVILAGGEQTSSRLIFSLPCAVKMFEAYENCEYAFSPKGLVSNMRVRPGECFKESVAMQWNYGSAATSSLLHAMFFYCLCSLEISSKCLLTQIAVALK